MKRLLGLTLAATAGLALATTATAAPLRIRGTIVATTSDSLTAHTANGDVTTIAVGSEPHGLTVWPQPGRYSLGHTGNMR